MNREHSPNASVNTNSYVNAMAWDQLRKSVSKKTSQRGGARVPSVAAIWSDVDCGLLQHAPLNNSERLDRDEFVNTSFPIGHLSCMEWEPMLEQVTCESIDRFFSELDTLEPTLSISETMAQETESEFELELSILESIQDISIEVYRSKQSAPTVSEEPENNNSGMNPTIRS